jgi:hypothetical protein
MLLLLLLLPLGGLELLVIPAILWTMGPAAWHLPEAIVIVIVIALAVMALTRRYREGSAERRASLAEQATWRWPPTMPAEQFRLRLITFLQLHGWRIASSAVSDRSRLEVIARKDRCFLALLLVSPAQGAGDGADLERLSALRTTTGASHAAIVEAAPASALATVAGVMRIRYEDLPTLDEAIGLQVEYFRSERG